MNWGREKKGEEKGSVRLERSWRRNAAAGRKSRDIGNESEICLSDPPLRINTSSPILFLFLFLLDSVFTFSHANTAIYKTCFS